MLTYFGGGMNLNMWVSGITGFGVWLCFAVRHHDKMSFWILMGVMALVGFVLPSLDSKFLKKSFVAYFIPILGITLGAWRYDSWAVAPLGFLLTSYMVTLGFSKNAKTFYEFLILGASFLFITLGYHAFVLGNFSGGANVAFPQGIYIAFAVMTAFLWMSLSYKTGFNAKRAVILPYAGLPLLLAGLIPALAAGGATGVLRDYFKLSNNPLEQTRNSGKPVFHVRFYGETPKMMYWPNKTYEFSKYGYKWFSLHDTLQRSSGNLDDFQKNIRIMTYLKKTDTFEDKGTHLHYAVRYKGVQGRPLLYGTVPVSPSKNTAKKDTLSDRENHDGTTTHYAYALKNPQRIKMYDEGMPDNIRQMLLSVGPSKKREEESFEQNIDKLSEENFAQEVAPETFALSKKLREGAFTDRQYMYRVLTHFRQTLRYNFDFQSNNPQKNTPDYFLFEQKKGVCRHFANSFALLMRMQGVPARVVTGWRGGGYNPQLDQWSVRVRDAHAWTEVWLDHRWVLVDPTDVVPVEKGIPESQGWWGGADLLEFSDIREFSTEGEMSPEDNEEAQEPRIWPSVPLFFWWVAGLLGLGLGTLLLWPRNAAKEWQNLLMAGEQKGWGDLSVLGPRTAMAIMAKHTKTPEQFHELGLRYEKYLYAGHGDKNLAFDIRKARLMLLR